VSRWQVAGAKHRITQVTDDARGKYETRAPDSVAGTTADPCRRVSQNSVNEVSAVLERPLYEVVFLQYVSRNVVCSEGLVSDKSAPHHWNQTGIEIWHGFNSSLPYIPSINLGVLD
jgi:hypothetical protein